MKIKYSLPIAAVFSLFLCLSAALAQGKDGQVDAAFRGEAIDLVVRLLKDKYPYPEVAAKMETELRTRQKRGDYDALADGAEFAKRLTADLRGVFDDKHLSISYSVKPIPERSAAAGAPTPKEIEQARMKQRRENFGVSKLEILKGNVGLIQLGYFAPLDWVKETYTAAFGYLANTDALIIDARRNTGSMDINTVPFFSGYLFEQPVQIGDYHDRSANGTKKIMSFAEVPGKRFLNKPVFVLTSGRTSSGAETFVSAVKRHNRATLVGETTMGATMPGMSHRVNAHLSMWVSTGKSSAGKAENENKGTPPHIAVPAESALTEAHRQALDRLAQTADADWKTTLLLIRSELANTEAR